MKKYCILFNPRSGNRSGKNSVESLIESLNGAEVSKHDITSIKDYRAFFAGLSKDVAIIVCGGDGTLSRFANDAYESLPENDILFYATGTGNDFLNDLGISVDDQKEPIDVKKYIVDLPTVVINGEEHKFVNGIGYGIDGYCCEVGDKLRAKGDGKPINYTSIAIKGLLFHYKPTNATVTVDGVRHEFKKVWLTPTMNGRMYGGGMIATPDQNRLKNDTVSTLVFNGAGRLRTLMAFPAIFKGEHVKNPMCKVFTGKHVVVEFDRPVALQIDGETYLNISKYEVFAKVTAKNSLKEPAAV